MNDAKVYQGLVASLQARFPGYTVKPKEANPIMKIAAVEMWPFARDFLNGFTTTWGMTTWMPSAVIASNPWRDIWHEGHHVRQYRAAPVAYNLAYAFPQLLILPMFAAFFAVAAVLASPLWLLGVLAFHPIGLGLVIGGLAITSSPLYLLGLLMFVPLLAPAPWRAKYEREAYLATMIADGLRWGPGYLGDTRYRQMHIDHYTGGGYLFMLPFPSVVAGWVDADIAHAKAILAGTVIDPIYTAELEIVRGLIAAAA